MVANCNILLFSKEKGKLLGYGAKNEDQRILCIRYGGRIKCFLYVINIKKR